MHASVWEREALYYWDFFLFCFLVRTELCECTENCYCEGFAQGCTYPNTWWGTLMFGFSFVFYVLFILLLFEICVSKMLKLPLLIWNCVHYLKLLSLKWTMATTSFHIWVFPQATSALDTVSERLVQDALNHLMRGRTTLVIAHRLSTVQNAHQIALCSDGRIKELGTHSELLGQKGQYASLVCTQRLAFEW